MSEQTTTPGPQKVAIVGGARCAPSLLMMILHGRSGRFRVCVAPTPRITRWFEMHALEDLRSQLKRDTKRRLSYRNYMKFLEATRLPRLHADRS